MNNRGIFLQNCVVLDVETTSLDYKTAEVLELGYILTIEGERVRLNNLYKPHDIITPEISSITNITQRMVNDCAHFEDEAAQFIALVDAYGDDGICIAHNAFYDSSVLKRYGFNRDLWICTLRLAKKLFAEDNTITNFKLPYLRYRFGILDPADHKIEAHRADSDALVTSHLLEYFVILMEDRGIIDKDKPYAAQILAWLDEPIVFTQMPFGKHKGIPLVDVPLDYWKWALDKMDILDETKENYDADFAASVAIALEKIMDS